MPFDASLLQFHKHHAEFMPDYRSFSPEELAADPSFRRWILQRDASETVIWQKWLDLNPDKKEDLDKACHLLLFVESAFDAITEEDVDREIHRLSHAIGEKSVRRFWRSFSPRPLAYPVAASVLLLLGLGWWINNRYGEQKPIVAYQEILDQVTDPLVVEENNSDQPRLVALNDGTTVLLQPRSKLTFPTGFEGDRREVFLSGEAFFDVAKNPEKPFFVYAGSLATKVLGTSFKVSAFAEEDEVRVVVKTGKVSVFPLLKEDIARHQAQDSLTGIILSPNQQIVFTNKDLRLTRSAVAESKILELPIQRESFEFQATPIREVFSALEKSYGVKIVFDEIKMKNCYLTASLSDEPLFEKIMLICKTIGAEYQQTGTSIFITGQGC